MNQPSPQTNLNQIIDRLNPLVANLGYEVVYLEVQTHRQKTLRVFIDFLTPAEGKSVGIQDCVQVTKALDEPLDQLPEVEAIFHGPYELEVSSPGVDRPLRSARDFERFAGKDVRIHVYRPLSADEMGNAGYQGRNPKQKNFFGTLKGFRNERVLLAIDPTGGDPVARKAAEKAARKAERLAAKKAAETKKGAAGNGPGAGSVLEKAALAKNSGEEVTIPLPLISKANLEPKFEFELDERE